MKGKNKKIPKYLLKRRNFSVVFNAWFSLGSTVLGQCPSQDAFPFILVDKECSQTSDSCWMQAPADRRLKQRPQWPTLKSNSGWVWPLWPWGWGCLSNHCSCISWILSPSHCGNIKLGALRWSCVVVLSFGCRQSALLQYGVWSSSLSRNMTGTWVTVTHWVLPVNKSHGGRIWRSHQITATTGTQHCTSPWGLLGSPELTLSL